MKKLVIGLIGNPNSGKTTLFNALTGSNQYVGNWPRVTVERKSGHFELENDYIEVVDLPGVYSLSVVSDKGAIDELIAAEYLLSANPDLVINVLDASNLERNLYLTTQLLELDIPVILAINMQDIAKKRGITIDINKLSEAFACPAIGLVSSKKQGVDELKKLIIGCKAQKKRKLIFPYPEVIRKSISALMSKIAFKQNYFIAIRLLEDDALAKQKVSVETVQLAQQQKQEISANLHEDADILIADTRYGIIHKIVKQVVTESVHVRDTVTAAIDRIVLNRVLGIPIFLGVMYLMFLFAINLGGIAQNFFQIKSNAIFVSGLAHLLINWNFPGWLVAILTTGIGKGINTTIAFIPVLTAMFLFLAVLENSGYMARAGFVVDRLMTAIGLPGKSFVPMLIGFGCNVPAIMAARTLENQCDRIITVMMTPFMSCGARLAIYAIFTAAFFPEGGQNIVFMLYLIGILIAILTGLILRKTILKGQQSPLVMELPPYHCPTLANLMSKTWYRLKAFIIKAGKVIVPACLIISILNTINIGANENRISLLSAMGRTITPIFKPIGITQNNWPATVGLITGVMAKEVVVATLNTLYAKVDNVGVQKQKFRSHHEIYGQMYKRFAGKVGAFAYLLFVLLYFPCIPAIAVMFRELSWRWATFSIFWNTGVAYSAATVFYQAVTFKKHPLSASILISAIVIIFLSILLVMRLLRSKNDFI